ncbi:hypothetical protein GCM10027284_20130 [Cyclobacterium sediminis]
MERLKKFERNFYPTNGKFKGLIANQIAQAIQGFKTLGWLQKVNISIPPMKPIHYN